MAREKIAVYLGMLEEARAATLAAAEQVAPERRLFQLGEGRSTPLWLLGHLAMVCDGVVLGWMFGQESAIAPSVRLKFAPDIAGGRPPTTDPEDYPAWNELAAVYDSAMGKVIERVATLEDAVLPEPLPGDLPERLRAIFSSHEVTLNRIISHDAYHRGQMVLLGKSA